MAENELILDIVPIYENEMYPTEEEIYHFKYTKLGNETRETILPMMFEQIKRTLYNCQALIVLEKGMVIKVL